MDPQEAAGNCDSEKNAAEKRSQRTLLCAEGQKPSEQRQERHPEGHEGQGKNQKEPRR
jgi:hypothetical protein